MNENDENFARQNKTSSPGKKVAWICLAWVLPIVLLLGAVSVLVYYYAFYKQQTKEIPQPVADPIETQASEPAATGVTDP